MLDLVFDVFNFVDSLPSVSVALAAEGLDSNLAAKEDVCIACLDAGPRGDLVLVHGGHGGDQSAMHGMCRLCMCRAVYMAKREERELKCPVCRRTSFGVSLSTETQDDHAIIARLTHADPIVRRFALEAVKDLDDLEGHTETVAARLKDDDLRVRIGVIKVPKYL